MIYFVLAEGVGHIKIGFTDDEDPAGRVATLQTGSPVPLRVIGTRPGTIEDEKDFHRRFASARVNGEWFKPVPELLGLINPVNPLTCGAVEVAERSVQIRVLTVGRKQFTRALLNQLPQRWAINWPSLCEMIDEGIQAGASCNDIKETVSAKNYLSTEVTVWGFVTPGDKTRWIVFEQYGELWKTLDQFDSDKFLPKSEVTAFNDHWRCSSEWKERWEDTIEACVAVFRTRISLPGWSDQLFIGV